MLNTISVFVAVRIMALWSRNLYLGVFLFLLGLVNPSSLTQVTELGIIMITVLNIFSVSWIWVHDVNCTLAHDSLRWFDCRGE